MRHGQHCMVPAIGQPLLKIQPLASIRLTAGGIEEIHDRTPLKFAHGVRQQWRTFSDVLGEQVKIRNLRRRFGLSAAKCDNVRASECEDQASQAIFVF